MNADIFALLFKVTAILAAAALAAFVLKKASASWRHFVWFAAMSSVIVLVVLQLVVPPIVVRVNENSLLRAFARDEAKTSFASPITYATVLPVASSEMSAELGRISDARSRGDIAAPRVDTHLVRQAIPAASAVNSGEWVKTSAKSEVEKTPPAGASSTSSFRIVRDEIGLALMLIWIAGSVLLLLRTAHAHWQLRLMVKSSHVINNPVLTEELARLSTQLDVTLPVRLLMHDRVDTPCTAGWRTSMIMIPSNFDEWSDARRKAVFTHELAHIARRDSIAQTVASVSCALFWFHPAFWIAGRLLRSESERAADDVVISAGMPAIEYAGHLLALADLSSSMNHAPVAAVGMARASQLETRLRAMLNTQQPRHTLARTTQRVLGTAALFALVPFSGLQARIQDPSQVQPPAAAKKPPVVAPKGKVLTSGTEKVVAPPTVNQKAPGTWTERPPNAAIAPPTVVPKAGDTLRASPPKTSPPKVVPPMAAAPIAVPPIIDPPLAAPPTVLASGRTSPPSQISREGPKWTVLPAAQPATLQIAQGEFVVMTKEIPATPGQELEIAIMSGGSVIVHGWDEPKAKLRATIGGEHVRQTKVALARLDRGINLTSLVEDSDAQLLFTPAGDSLPFDRLDVRVRVRGAQSALAPITLDNKFELWVPKQTNIKFSSWGGDLTLDNVQGTFSGRTPIGNIKANNSRGGASLSTAMGNLDIASSTLNGAMTTDCGTVAQSDVTGGLKATSAFDPLTMPDIGRDSDAKIIIIDGVIASDYCLLKSRGGGVRIPGWADENYPYGDIVRDSAAVGGTLSTRSGSIKVGVVGGVFGAFASKGNVEIGKMTGDGTLIANGGNVSARIENSTGPIHYITVRASRGNVTIELPESLDATIDVETGYSNDFTSRMNRAATITSDIALTRTEETRGASNVPMMAHKFVKGTAKVGNGRGRILIRVTDGDVILKRTK